MKRQALPVSLLVNQISISVLIPVFGTVNVPDISFIYPPAWFPIGVAILVFAFPSVVNARGRNRSVVD